MRICWIGFGEAGSTFAAKVAAPGAAFDLRDDAAMRAAMAEAGVDRAESCGEAVRGAALILSLVTADQALVAAEAVAASPLSGALYCDMNSVAPDTKRAAAERIAAAGGRYVDVAVMAPVWPQSLGVPLLVCGPDAEAATAALAEMGFTSVEIVGDRIGAASSVKMIRSVMVKGLEALSAECALAADAEGVLDKVVASLDASWAGGRWADRMDYNLDRMLAHGERRAAEMSEVARTLEGLGISPLMARGAIDWQQAMGALAIDPPPGLGAKLGAIRARMKALAA